MRKAIGLMVSDGYHLIDESQQQELKSLARSISIDCVFFVQQRRSVRQQTLIGQGKMEELHSMLLSQHINLVIVNQAISPLFTKQLESALQVEIMDKASLVLHIFSIRAKSKLSRMYVELAQTQQALSHLSGSYQKLSRQGGASGSLAAKGAGEKQLQLDRRIMNRKIVRLKEAIKKETNKREVANAQRKQKQPFTVALVGYTNVGKSTLMNQLLSLSKENKQHKQVVSDNQVFTSLETTTRKIHIASYSPFLLVDTVGFISDLPQVCVDSFKSTLQESKDADLVIVVLDATSDMIKQKEAIDHMIESLDFKHQLVVINKSDVLKQEPLIREGLMISALDPASLTPLLQAIMEIKFAFDFEVTGKLKNDDYMELRKFDESVYIKQHTQHHDHHIITAKIKEPYRFLELLFEPI